MPPIHDPGRLDVHPRGRYRDPHIDLLPAVPRRPSKEGLTCRTSSMVRSQNTSCMVSVIWRSRSVRSRRSCARWSRSSVMWISWTAVSINAGSVVAYTCGVRNRKTIMPSTSDAFRMIGTVQQVRASACSKMRRQSGPMVFSQASSVRSWYCRECSCMAARQSAQS